MATVAILGGGVSGLSCAYYLKTLGRNRIKYVFLLEKGPKFGGWIQTTKYPDGAVFEHGPRSLRVLRKPGYNALALASELGLTSDVIPITRDHPATKNRMILINNQLHILPNSFRYLIRTIPPFSKPLYHCVIKDLSTKKCEASDESVHAFAERRFGKEVADFVFNPMVRGISAGDSRETSVRSLIPTMFEGDQKHESIIKSMIHNAKKGSDISEFSDSTLVYRARNEFWRMWSLKNGLSSFIDALACATEETGAVDLHFNAECTGLSFKDNKGFVTVDGETIEVDHVFSSIPSTALAKLLKPYSTLSQQLASINSVTVSVVYLEYDGFVHSHEAFGFLTPSFEDSKVLGIVFDSCCFPEQNGISRTRLTCMMGGKWFSDLFGDPNSVTDDTILNVAISEAKRHLDIKADPVRYRVVTQKECIPQYSIGHHQKLDRIHDEIKANNLCLSVIGASYNGAGVPDCIYNSKLSVKEYLQNN